MPAAVPVIEPLMPEQLPPRTWHQWWRQTSSLFRCFVWGFSAFVIVHSLLAARIAIGLQEEAVLTEFRSRGSFNYRWETYPEEFPGQHWLLDGLFGRSCRNVHHLDLTGQATDADLEVIGCDFSQLNGLDLTGTEITSAGLKPLLRCNRLEHLDLTDTDIDDDGVKLLAELPRLHDLDLGGTLITDASVPILRSMSSLQMLELAWTDLTPAACQTFDRTRLNVSVSESQFPRLVHAVIRWSDGEICERFPEDPSYHEDEFFASKSSATKDIPAWMQFPEGLFVTADERLRREETEGISGMRLRFQTTISCSFGPHVFGRSQLNQRVTEIVSQDIARGDNECSLSISFGDCKSETITYQIHDGDPFPDRFEFRMPMTRAEARGAAQVNEQPP